MQDEKNVLKSERVNKKVKSRKESEKSLGGRKKKVTRGTADL